ncbi:DNA-binding protein [Xylophilus sp. Leaf220]|nr:DNA-binding protein [Xylophilus sp. Leaf220]
MTFILSTADEVLQTVGDRLRVHRLAQAMSQQELASTAGLSQGAVRQLERNGQSSLDTLVRVVQALGLVGELDDLFVPRRQSIAQMDQAEAAGLRQRAPRQKKP